jgi:hypothetical protein
MNSSGFFENKIEYLVPKTTHSDNEKEKLIEKN